MIEAVSAPVEILSSFTRVNPITNELQIHRYESVNGGFARHVVDYKVYNSQGVVEQPHKPNVDVTI